MNWDAEQGRCTRTAAARYGFDALGGLDAGFPASPGPGGGR